LIRQDVASLQAGYERFAEAHAKLQQAYVKLEFDMPNLNQTGLANNPSIVQTRLAIPAS
jgi:hypothetical protein